METLLLYYLSSLAGLVMGDRGDLAALQAEDLHRPGDEAGHGDRGLTVVLQPPNGRGAEVVTSTDSQGGFSFSGLAGGRHVLSVSQGVTLLYREVVQVSGGAVKEIRLRRG